MPTEAGQAETLSGRVERVVYHDARSRYTVLRLHVPGHDTLVTAVGRIGDVEPGADVTVTGQWDEHPQHGKQFAFTHMHVETPATLAGIERRLKRYPGVKDVMASRIVARFGMDTLDVLATQPRRLLEVEGIGIRTLERILEHHRSQTGPVAQLEATLLELDLPAYLAEPIFERYGDAAAQTLREQPYRLARDVRGIGFATADRIARALGVDVHSPDRVDAGLLHVLEQAEQDGHCALPIEDLVTRAAASLEVDDVAVREAGQRMVAAGHLVLDYSTGGVPLCFPAKFVEAERDIAAQLNLIARAPRTAWTLPELPDHLSPGQVEAVHAVAEHGVVVLTGGPGTGKSTVVRQIIELARANGAALQLAAPTGRAAKRLEQTTGVEASTVHRLLEFQPENGRFARGPADPLPPALIVIDECSMLDTMIAASLFAALTPAHRVLLVGDADQLPSVGAGNVLQDIMHAAAHPDTAMHLVRLAQVFRQAEGSSIIANAHRILAGDELRPDPSGERGQFFVVPARDADHAHALIVKMATERIPAAYGLDHDDIQVLCPMHKGRAGTEALNRTLQDFHTQGHTELRLRSASGYRVFRVGDRVMQTRNDYDKGVFNGDVGTVAVVRPDEEEVAVDFDGVRTRFTGKDVRSLQLAYAVSIHKSQGSEFEAVLIAMLAEHHVMLQRNLLYTAVTRAKQLCVLVGDPRAIRRAVLRVDAGRRYTALGRRLVEAMTEPLPVEVARVPAARPLGD